MSIPGPKCNGISSISMRGAGASHSRRRLEEDLNESSPPLAHGIYSAAVAVTLIKHTAAVVGPPSIQSTSATARLLHHRFRDLTWCPYLSPNPPPSRHSAHPPHSSPHSPSSSPKETPRCGPDLDSWRQVERHYNTPTSRPAHHLVAAAAAATSPIAPTPTHIACVPGWPHPSLPYSDPSSRAAQLPFPLDSHRSRPETNDRQEQARAPQGQSLSSPPSGIGCLSTFDRPLQDSYMMKGFRQRVVRPMLSPVLLRRRSASEPMLM